MMSPTSSFTWGWTSNHPSHTIIPSSTSNLNKRTMMMTTRRRKKRTPTRKRRTPMRRTELV